MNKEQQELIKKAEELIEQTYQQELKNAELRKEIALLKLAKAIV